MGVNSVRQWRCYYRSGAQGRTLEWRTILAVTSVEMIQWLMQMAEESLEKKQSCVKYPGEAMSL